MKAVLVSIAMLAAAPVYAQSSLGVTGADLSFGVEQDEQGDAQGRVSALVDVAITANHGTQGDLTFNLDRRPHRAWGRRCRRAGLHLRRRRTRA